eukprot:11309289-Alexandrium_andersonii.AAC.1
MLVRFHEAWGEARHRLKELDGVGKCQTSASGRFRALPPAVSASAWQALASQCWPPPLLRCAPPNPQPVSE